MSDYLELICQRCGGRLQPTGKIYKCECCAKTYEKKVDVDIDESINRAFDERKSEQIANLRQLLWKEINREFTSNRNITELCNKILTYLPEDFYANFYLATCSESKGALADFLNGVDINEHYGDIPDMLDYLITGLKNAWSLCVGNLIERAYKNSDLNSDFDLYNKYRTKFEEQNAKVEDGVFEPSIRRDVFVAYSSADMPKVESLVSALERENLTCFVAARNLRHGSGAADNYANAIHTAIDNCSVLVFVSSINSRSTNCDAFKELNYIKANRPDMLRVQYILQNYCGRAAERNFKEFFEGLEYCTTEKDVAERVSLLLMNAQAPEVKPVEEKKSEQKKPEQKQPRAEQERNPLLTDKNISRLFDIEYYQLDDGGQNVCLTKYKGMDRDVVIPEGVTTIGSGAFKDCIFIDSITIPDSVTYICSKAFYGCSSLKTVYYSGTASQWASISFYCFGTIGLDFSNPLVFGSKLYINGTLAVDIILEDITEINAYAFVGCTSLKSIILPNNLTSIGRGAFARCTSLESITIPASVKFIGPQAFNGCSSMTKLVFKKKGGWHDKNLYISRWDMADPVEAAKHLKNASEGLRRGKEPKTPQRLF